ncbi:hypothetical protein HQ487_03285 [Candidatus Uhrbacteria bacterium]|nr:hypothetical protein [Candidatus Uhrbacteria bacterium]
MANPSMPATVQCSRCKRDPFPPNGQVAGQPILVVLLGVSSVETALTSAICYWCAKAEKEPVHSLFDVLTKLGVKEAGGSVMVLSLGRSQKEEPLIPVAVSLYTEQSKPSLTGVSIVRSAPPPRVEHLRGGLEARNLAVLSEARERAGEAERLRREARKRSDLGRFGALMRELRKLLRDIRRVDPTQPVHEIANWFDATLKSASQYDPKKRSTSALMEHLGTSDDEIEQLCLFMVIQASQHRRLKGRHELVQMDAFEGGHRPVFWDKNCKEVGRSPSFYQLWVLRPVSKLPRPNAPLPTGDGGPSPRVSYPVGGEYGSEFTIEDSRRSEPQDYRRGYALLDLTLWSVDHQDEAVTVNGVRINLSDVLIWYMESLLSDPEEALSDTIVVQPSLADAITT